MNWGPVEDIRWLRVRLDLPDEQVADYKLEERACPQGLSPEELDQYIRDVNAGLIPEGEVTDWGYGEYLVPLEVLQAHARVEGPFTCDAETDDPELTSTVEWGVDLIAVEEVDEEPLDA